MLSMQDCLDFCDLTEDEIRQIAHHQQISYPCAAQLACALSQDREGECKLRHMLAEALVDAAAHGRTDTVQMASRAMRDFCLQHPI